MFEILLHMCNRAADSVTTLGTLHLQRQISYDVSFSPEEIVSNSIFRQLWIGNTICCAVFLNSDTNFRCCISPEPTT
jgi:hypothetical protein